MSRFVFLTRTLLRGRTYMLRQLWVHSLQATQLLECHLLHLLGQLHCVQPLLEGRDNVVLVAIIVTQFLLDGLSGVCVRVSTT